MSGRLTRAHTRFRKVPILTAVAALGSGLLLLAAAGDIDPTFGTQGVVRTHFGGFDAATAVAVQSDGKIVAAGVATDLGFNPIFAVARYDATGALDPTFGAGGKVEIDFYASTLRVDLAIDANGHIVVAGTAPPDPFGFTDFAIARLTPAGALDATFGTGGKVVTDFYGHSDEGNAIAIQSDGKIVVGGTARRGDLNQSVGIADFAVARYNADGSLDASFDGDGRVTTDVTGLDEFGNGVAVQADGKIVLVGAMSGDFAVLRYDAAGTLDTSFHLDGLVTTDFVGEWDEAYAVVIQPDNRILVVGGAVVPNAIGWFQDFALARYEPNGSPDPGFGAGGEVLNDFSSGGDVATDVLLQADGKIVAAGWVADPADIELLIDFGLARYDPNGAVDPTFGNAGRVITDLGYLDYGQAVALHGDCRIVMAGYSWPIETGDAAFALVRYDAGGCAVTITTCPKTHGFWQNNADAWPVSSLTLGSQTYTKAELLAILNMPTKGDASLALAQQLIAAMLNVANGSDPAPISATIAHANTLLSGYAGKLPYGVKISTAIGQQMVADLTLLDQYNRGLLTGCAGAAPASN